MHMSEARHFQIAAPEARHFLLLILDRKITLKKTFMDTWRLKLNIIKSVHYKLANRVLTYSNSFLKVSNHE